MQNNKGSYWEDVERNRVFTVALIYEQTADKLAPWDAAAAEEFYERKRRTRIFPWLTSTDHARLHKQRY